MIDFTSKLVDLDNKDIVSADSVGNSRPMTLGLAAATALLSQTDDDSKLTGEDKVRRYALAMKVISSAEASLRAEEIAEIKKVVAKIYGPLIVGQAWMLLDPSTKG